MLSPSLVTLAEFTVTVPRCTLSWPSRLTLPVRVMLPAPWVENAVPLKSPLRVKSLVAKIWLPVKTMSLAKVPPAVPFHSVRTLESARFTVPSVPMVTLFNWKYPAVTDRVPWNSVLMFRTLAP